MKTATSPIRWQAILLEYFALAVIFVIPLWGLSGNLFRFTSTKSFLFMGVVCVMLFLWVWGRWREKSNTFRITWIHGVLALFALALGLSAILGVNPHASWFGTFQSGTGVVYLYAFIIWAVLIGMLVRRRPAFLDRFLVFALVSGAVVAITTFWNESGGPLGNTSYAGPYFLLCICIGIGLVWFYHTAWKKVAIVIGLVTIACSPVLLNPVVWHGSIIDRIAHMPLTMVGAAQGAVLGLGISFIIVVLLAMTRSKKTTARFIGAALFVLLLGGLWYGGHELITSGTPLNSYMVAKKTANRFVFWDIARAGLNDRPFTGWGWGNYDAMFQKYFDPIMFDPAYAVEPATTHPHNILWEYASTTGVFGLLSYIILFGTTLVVLYCASHTGDDQRARVFGITLAAGLVGYFIQNMFVFDTPVTYLVYFSIIGVAIGTTGGRTISISRFAMGALSITLIIISLAGFVWLSAFPAYESSLWTKSVTDRTVTSGRSPQHVSPVGEVSDTTYIASKLYARSKVGVLSQAQKDFFSKKFSLFINYLAEDAENNSKNYKTYLVKGILENGLVSLSGKRDEQLLSAAHSDLERAYRLNPNTPESYFNFAQTAVYERDFSTARAYVRAGIALAPRYKQGYEIARALLRSAPNSAFAQYISFMESKWLIHHD